MMGVQHHLESGDNRNRLIAMCIAEALTAKISLPKSSDSDDDGDGEKESLRFEVGSYGVVIV